MTPGPNLCRAWRIATNRTQSQAADFLCLSGFQKVSDYETGQRNLSARSRKMIEREIAERGIALDTATEALKKRNASSGSDEEVVVKKGEGALSTET